MFNDDTENAKNVTPDFFVFQKKKTSKGFDRDKAREDMEAVSRLLMCVGEDLGPQWKRYDWMRYLCNTDKNDTATRWYASFLYFYVNVCVRLRACHAFF